jgi:hypothetical protein
VLLLQISEKLESDFGDFWHLNMLPAINGITMQTVLGGTTEDGDAVYMGENGNSRSKTTTTTAMTTTAKINWPWRTTRHPVFPTVSIAVRKPVLFATVSSAGKHKIAHF